MTSERATLLVVEDDATIRDGVREAMRAQGFGVDVAADGDTARERLQAGGYDLVLLDLMLPGPGGFELLREFRMHDAKTPVIVLTARGDETDKVLGLELGADDYVTKPFGLRELIARVRAHLRRREQSAPEERTEPFALGDDRVDLAAFHVVIGGETRSLSPKEAEILELLWLERDRVVPRKRILDVVWGGTFVSDRTIDTHVLNLRRKLERDPKLPRHLQTVHGVGYRLLVDGR